MTFDGWADWCIAIGGTLQAGGVAVLVVGIVRASRRAEEYRTRPQVVELGTIEATATILTPRVVISPPPSIETRVAQLEEGLALLRSDLEKRVAELRSEARKAADEAAARSTRHGERRFSELERLIGETSVERWVRGLSIGAVVVGVVLATIGSIAA